MADVSESSYQQWLEIQHRASTSLQNRALKLEESYELIEKVIEKCVCVVSVPDAMTGLDNKYFIMEFSELGKGEAIFLSLFKWCIYLMYKVSYKTFFDRLLCVSDWAQPQDPLYN